MTEIKKMGITYRQLPNGTLTCGPLDQSGKLGGSGEAARNEEHNPERLHRIKQFHPNPRVLDFGCGTGMLMDFLNMNGIIAVGYDKYGVEARSQGKMPPDMFDVVTMIEVIEHMAAPYSELDEIFKTLKPGGVVMIETSFTDWMDLEKDPYINPAFGHSTIFSHAGLDEVMLETGFEVYGHINRNVRVYQKPDKPFNDKITLITMGQGNPVALKRTLDSFKNVVDEIIFGDVLIFESDREIINSYLKEYNMKIVRLPFNFIFLNGFGPTLNALAEFATNDWVLYMNVSEVLDGEHPVKEQMSKEYNCYSFDHATETHRWFRLYNRKELKWGGLIHEEVIGDLRLCPFNLFRMKDTTKDEENTFMAKVSNDVKEIVYWQQYMRLVDNPELRANTHQGWIDHATQDYDHFKERMRKKGKRYEAFEKGDLAMYLDDIHTNPEFEKERFKSTDLINFSDRKLL